MSNITIQNVELPVVEVEAQRVVTLAMVDKVHQRPEGTAKRNFQEHRSRFIEGEDFYEVTADEIRTQSLGHVFALRTPKGILLTESGYLMLVKSFTDDLAWEVQRKLVNSYFRVQSKHADPMRLLNDPAAMRGLLLTYTEKVLALEGAVTEERARADRAEDNLHVVVEKVEEMRPAVAALDRIANLDGSLCRLDAAKTLQIKPKAFMAFLRQNRWIYKRAGTTEDVAYQDKIVAGYLEHKTYTIVREDGSEKVVSRVRVLPKGLVKLAQIVPGAVMPQPRLFG
jgi:phage antirepressor YoqD-like protein